MPKEIPEYFEVNKDRLISAFIETAAYKKCPVRTKISTLEKLRDCSNSTDLYDTLMLFSGTDTEWLIGWFWDAMFGEY